MIDADESRFRIGLSVILSGIPGGISMRKLLVAGMLFGAMQGAQAADLPILRGALPDSYGPRVVNWEGVYFGGQVQYGSATSKPSPGINGDLQSTFVSPPGSSYNWVGLGTAQDNRIGYGGFIGYNSQWDDVVIGVEANYIHSGYNALTNSTGYAPLNGSPITSTTLSSAQIQSSDFGSARIRAGYAIGSFLPYMFAGAGFGNQTVVRQVSADPAPLPLPTLRSYDTHSKLVYGYSAGAGVDVMLVAGLFMRVEYEYQRITSAIETSAHSVRGGLGYKF